MDVIGGALIALLIIVIWQMATTRTKPGRAVASASLLVLGSVVGVAIAAVLYAVGFERSLVGWASIALLVALVGQAVLRSLQNKRSGGD